MTLPDAKVLADMRVLGWHADSETAVRVLLASPLFHEYWTALRRAYNEGIRERLRGRPCGCFTCFAEQERAQTVEDLTPQPGPDPFGFA
jgi:hypothetical protein